MIIGILLKYCNAYIIFLIFYTFYKNKRIFFEMKILNNEPNIPWTKVKTFDYNHYYLLFILVCIMYLYCICTCLLCYKSFVKIILHGLEKKMCYKTDLERLYYKLAYNSCISYCS